MGQVESQSTAVPSLTKISPIRWTTKGSLLTYLWFTRLFSNDHDRLLCMANRGPHTNSSQFFITVRACPHLNGNVSPVLWIELGSCKREPRQTRRLWPSHPGLR